METLAYRASGFAPDGHLSHRGLPDDAISWQFSAPQTVDGAAGGYRLGGAVSESGLNGPIGHATRLLSCYGSDLKSAVRATFGTALTVAVIGAVIPDERSFIALSSTQTDVTGLHSPVIKSVLTENSLRLLDRKAKSARTLLAEAGVQSVIEQSSSWDAFSATHVFGTCRMGNDAASTVVNQECRSHDHDNLFITDASVFPSSGGGRGESPSLTISALALRAVDFATR